LGSIYCLRSKGILGRAHHKFSLHSTHHLAICARVTGLYIFQSVANILVSILIDYARKHRDCIAFFHKLWLKDLFFSCICELRKSLRYVQVMDKEPEEIRLGHDNLVLNQGIYFDSHGNQMVFI